MIASKDYRNLIFCNTGFIYVWGDTGDVYFMIPIATPYWVLFVLFCCKYCKCCNSFQPQLWRRSGLLVGVLASASSGQGLSPGQGHCVVFFGKTHTQIPLSCHFLLTPPPSIPEVLFPCPTPTETTTCKLLNVGKFQSYFWPCHQDFCLFIKWTIALPNKRMIYNCAICLSSILFIIETVLLKTKQKYAHLFPCKSSAWEVWNIQKYV